MWLLHTHTWVETHRDHWHLKDYGGTHFEGLPFGYQGPITLVTWTCFQDTTHIKQQYLAGHIHATLKEMA